MKPRIFGLENEYGLIFSPNGRIYLPMEKVLGYIFEGLIPNSWPSNAFLVNGARFYQDTGCHPEYSTPECDSIVDLVVHDKAGERLLEACLPAAEERLREARSAVESAAAVEHGPSLLPVLAGRRLAVDRAVVEAFPHLSRGRRPSITDYGGAAMGARAANSADLGGRNLRLVQ